MSTELLQDSVQAPLLQNIHTNDQTADDITRCFMYADYLHRVLQQSIFEAVEQNSQLPYSRWYVQYYATNKPNASKTKVRFLHPRNRGHLTFASVLVSRCIGSLPNSSLSWSLTGPYSQLQETNPEDKAKVETRNKILKKLSNSKKFNHNHNSSSWHVLHCSRTCLPDLDKIFTMWRSLTQLSTKLAGTSPEALSL